MGKHNISLGKKGVADIGFLVSTAIGEKERYLEEIRSLWGKSERPHWKDRIASIEKEVKELQAYECLFIGAKEMTLTHHVNQTETEKE